MALKVILNKEQEHVQSIRLLRASAQTDLEYFQGRGIPVLTPPTPPPLKSWSWSAVSLPLEWSSALWEVGSEGLEFRWNSSHSARNGPESPLSFAIPLLQSLLFCLRPSRPFPLPTPAHEHPSGQGEPPGPE